LPDAIKPAGRPDAAASVAISAWNLCGGMDWNAIPFVADMLGIRDVEGLIYQMSAIRDHLKKGE
jgi:hypothetical protein